MPNSQASNRDVTLADFLAFATARLKNAGIDNPGFDARLLIAHGLKTDHKQLLSQAGRILDKRETNLIGVLIECRARHKPVARIIGEREFWSLTFGLNEATLEPRPDSETLVEAALKAIPDKNAPLRMLDLGTGTGCLLLSLLHELPNATGLGIDKAVHAVAQARTNAERLQLTNRVKFQTGNWFEGLSETFNAIISNPPYIAHREIASLTPEVRDHDPRLALDGGVSGYDAYLEFVPQLPHFLNKNGLAIFEVGVGQAAKVAAILKTAGLADISVHKDLAGIERCVIGRKE